MENGIARVELFSPFSVYDDGLGYHGSMRRMFRYQGKLHILDDSGVLYELIHPDREKPYSQLSPVQMQFRRVSNLSAKWDLIPFGNSLLKSLTDGIYQIQNGKSHFVSKTPAVINIFYRSRIDTNRVYVGCTAGLFSIRRIGQERGSEKWINEGEFKGIPGMITRIIETRNGDLWLETNGLYPVHVKFSQMPGAKAEAPTRRELSVERYGSWHGLPNSEIYIYPTTSHPVFVTEKGIFRFIEETGRFVPDSTYGSRFADGTRGVGMLVEDRHGNAWIARSEAFESVLYLARRQADSSYELVRIPFLNVSVGRISAISPEDNGIAWFGGTEGIVRYDSNIQQDLRRDFPTLKSAH